MKKWMGIFLAAALAAGTVTGCGGGGKAETAKAPAGGKETAAPAGTKEEAGQESGTDGAEAKAPAAEETFTMQVGHAQATTSARHQSLLLFEKTVEEKTNGGVQVEIYPAGQLGNETEMTEAVSMGTLQAVRGGELEYLPQITMLSLPMLCDSLEEVRTLCYSDFVKNMLSSVETEHNMKVLAVGDDSGFRQITNNVRPILSPADMEGLKMRTVLEVIDLSMKSFGASTVSVPFTDLYMALKTGVADGQENPVALIDSQKFYEVQKYCSIIDYMFCAEVMYVNLDWWNSLPEEYQTVLAEASREMMDENSRITDEENDNYIEHIKNSGCEVTVLTPEQRESFRPQAEAVWKEYIESGRITREDLDEMLAVIGKKVSW